MPKPQNNALVVAPSANPRGPAPANVVTIYPLPEGVSFRILLPMLLSSVVYTLYAESTATLIGAPNVALKPGPSLYPGVPVPAIVVTTPVDVIFRI